MNENNNRQFEEAAFSKVEPTKSQMVDYINTRVRFQGKKLPKYKLNSLSTEELMSIINSNPEMKTDFEKYVSEAVANPQKTSSSKRASKKVVLAEVSEEKTRELWEAVNELVNDPFSLLAMMKFNSILGSLPYGAVSTDELNKMVSTLTHADQNVMGMGVKLLEYSIKQASYTNK